MNGPADHPLLGLIEGALAALDAEPLGVAEDSLLVAYGELELAVAWSAVDACLQATDPQRWLSAVADLVVEQAAAARGRELVAGQALPLVLPLLWAESGARALARRAPQVLAYDQAPGLYLTLAVPTANGRRYLLRDDIASLGTSSEELVAAGLANLRQRTPEGALEAISDGEAGISYGLACDDGLDSSRLLLLPSLLPQWAEQGLVAAIPARDFLVVAPFARAGLPALRGLAQVAHQGSRTMPHPLTGDLYWIGRGGLLHIAVSAGHDGRPHLDLPQALAEHQARLAAAGQW